MSLTTATAINSSLPARNTHVTVGVPSNCDPLVCSKDEVTGTVFVNLIDNNKADKNLFSVYVVAELAATIKNDEHGEHVDVHTLTPIKTTEISIVGDGTDIDNYQWHSDDIATINKVTAWFISSGFGLNA